MASLKESKDMPLFGWRQLRDAALENAQRTIELKILEEKPVFSKLAAMAVHFATHTAQTILPLVGLYELSNQHILPTLGVGVGTYLFRAGYDLGRISDNE